ncbi:MAG: hypothetical protein H3C35_12060 [Bacteroidetes bacterium]|nr:hypothetical protein [Bacteroidota bacterium]
MGRTAIYMVIGFSTIFLFIGKSYYDIKLQALDNSLNYYERSQLYNVASAGANIACSQLFQDNNWRAGYSDISFNGGKFSVTVTDTTERRVNIVSVGTFQGTTQVVRVLMQPSNFGKFAVFNGDEKGVKWASGDTVWGPYHTNSKLEATGSPVFYGKVSALEGKSGGTPKFYGGFTSGVSLPLPQKIITSDSAKVNGKYIDNIDTVWASFNSNGTVSIRQKKSVPLKDTSFTTLINAFAPNGAVTYYGAVIRVKGTVNGRVTFSTVGDSTSAGFSSSNKKGGKIFIDSSIVYNSNPKTNPNSTDMLGLVGTDSVIISNNTNNVTPTKKGIDLQAAIFTLKSFSAQDYSTIKVGGSYVGNIRLVGGITQNERGAVATSGGWGGGSGFLKSYFYDERLLVTPPPGYPLTGGFEIVSWFE